MSRSSILWSVSSSEPSAEEAVSVASPGWPEIASSRRKTLAPDVAGSTRSTRYEVPAAKMILSRPAQAASAAIRLPVCDQITYSTPPCHATRCDDDASTNAGSMSTVPTAYPPTAPPGTRDELKTAPVKDGSRRSPDSTHATRG